MNQDSSYLRLWAFFFGCLMLIPVGSRALSLTVREPARLSVDPAQNFATSGVVGGPFVPAEQVYTLSNEGGVPLSFTVAGDEDFVDVTPAGGTIPPGGSVSVTVSLTPAAEALAAGLHTASVDFANTTNGLGDTAIDAEVTVLTSARASTRSGATPASCTTCPAASAIRA